MKNKLIIMILKNTKIYIFEEYDEYVKRNGKDEGAYAFFLQMNNNITGKIIELEGGEQDDSKN